MVNPTRPILQETIVHSLPSLSPLLSLSWQSLGSSLGTPSSRSHSRCSAPTYFHSMLHIQYRKKAFADIKEPCSLAKGRSVTLGLKGGEGLSFSGFITSSFSLSAMHCHAWSFSFYLLFWIWLSLQYFVDPSTFLTDDTIFIIPKWTLWLLNVCNALAGQSILRTAGHPREHKSQLLTL